MNRISIAPFLFASQAFAHEGHGAATAAHWHATDTMGLVLVTVLAALAMWAARK